MTNKDERKKMVSLSRRRFLRNATLVASGAALWRCGRSGVPKDSLASHDAPTGDAADAGEVATDSAPTPVVPEVWLGLFPAGGDDAAVAAVRQVCAELDWSWLGPGDSVFVKVSCNSDKPHPSVTSPAAVTAVCAELFERGAGKVLVGDQAGIEYVRLAADGTLTGSTKECMEANGLLAAIEGAGATPHFIEKHGYDEGYFKATLPFSSNWSEGPYISSVIKEVDHIITLPRLSSHVIAGYTHAHKCAVGWLRDDSRYLMHFDAATMHEKYTELNYADEIASRHRLTITAGVKILLDMGPDQGTVAEADPMLVVASENMAHHDALTVALMAYVDDLTPPAGDLVFVYDKNCNDFNKMLTQTLVEMWYGVPWGKKDKSEYTDLPYHDYRKGVAHDRGLLRAYEILGGAPETVAVKIVGGEPATELAEFLTAHDDGRLGLSG